MKKIMTGIRVLLIAFAAAGAAAKAKKDIQVHGSHAGHDSCSCDRECLRCLLGK